LLQLSFEIHYANLIAFINVTSIINVIFNYNLLKIM